MHGVLQQFGDDDVGWLAHVTTRAVGLGALVQHADVCFVCHIETWPQNSIIRVHLWILVRSLWRFFMRCMDVVDVRISAGIGPDRSRMWLMFESVPGLDLIVPGCKIRAGSPQCGFTTATTMPVTRESSVSFVSPES